MKENDSISKTSKRPRLQHFDIKAQELGKEQASIVSFKRFKTLLKNFEEPLKLTL